MKKLLILLAGPAVLSACAAVPTATPIATPATMSAAGLERVLGQSAAGLTQLFGEPDQDFREDNGRKLQFAGSACILDTYLYARERGAEPVVTYVDARNATGDDVDRAGCVEALARR